MGIELEKGGAQKEEEGWVRGDIIGAEASEKRGAQEEEEGWVRGDIIGAGTSGTVSLASSSPNGQQFAVKSATGFSVALDNEYHILQCLDSPYIVRCLGRCYSANGGAGVHNLFMEYMPGGSLGDLLSKFGGKLDESVIRAYTYCILRGIDYLHSQGIVHGDIKGKNVLVDANGVKLADFGSAKRIGENQEALQLRGTPQWMAPEVVNQTEQGLASDIWSLACTVLEMATGRPPWDRVSKPLAAMYRIGCTEDLPEFPASISAQLQDFLEKCFRRDPKKRWSSAELLNHPYLNEVCPTMEKEVVVTGLGSPRSNFDFGNQARGSSTPILPLRILSPKRGCNAEVYRSIEQCPKPSPSDRLVALAAACKFKGSPDKLNWSPSSHGQWILVRSSKNKSPTSDKSLEKPHISNGVSIQELPFTEEKLVPASKLSTVKRIVVRSSKNKSPTEDKSLEKPDISKGVSIQELPFTEEKLVPASKFSTVKSCSQEVN